MSRRHRDIPPVGTHVRRRHRGWTGTVVLIEDRERRNEVHTVIHVRQETDRNGRPTRRNRMVVLHPSLVEEAT